MKLGRRRVFILVAILIAVLVVVILLSRTCGNNITEEDDVTDHPTETANFELGSLSITPAEVGEGDTVTIELLITNSGNASGSYAVEVIIDGEVEDTEQVTLSGGASKTLTFTTSRDIAGTYQVAIDGQTGWFTVKAPTETITPVAEWHFDEGSGTSASDNSGNGNYGTLKGDTYWTDGPTGFGGALAFNGEGDYVEIANEANFDFDKDDAFTIEAYVKTESDESMAIIYKMDETSNYYSLMKHEKGQDRYEPGGGNRLYLFLVNIYDASDGYRNTDAIVVWGSTDIADGEWHHVKVTYDGTNSANGIQIYVDGAPEIMHTRTYGENKDIWDTISESGTILNDAPLTISDRWDGLIDEVKVWEGVH